MSTRPPEATGSSSAAAAKAEAEAEAEAEAGAGAEAEVEAEAEAGARAGGRSSLWAALHRRETRTPVLLAVGVVLANNAMAALALQGFATQILSRAEVG